MGPFKNSNFKENCWSFQAHAISWLASQNNVSQKQIHLKTLKRPGGKPYIISSIYYYIQATYYH